MRLFRLSWLALPLLLAACSPHPGTGHWLPEGDNASGLSKLTVHFDGKAEIYASGEKPVMGCAWSAKSKDLLLLDCVDSTDTERTVRYTLQVVGEAQAELGLDGKAVGQFSRLER